MNLNCCCIRIGNRLQQHPKWDDVRSTMAREKIASVNNNIQYFCYEFRVHVMAPKCTATSAREGWNYSFNNNFLNHLISFDLIKPGPMVYNVLHTPMLYLYFSSEFNSLYYYFRAAVKRAKKTFFFSNLCAFHSLYFTLAPYPWGANDFPQKCFSGCVTFFFQYFFPFASIQNGLVRFGTWPFKSIGIEISSGSDELPLIVCVCVCVIKICGNREKKCCRSHFNHFHFFSQFRNSLCGAHLPFVYFNSDKTECSIKEIHKIYTLFFFSLLSSRLLHVMCLYGI